MGCEIKERIRETITPQANTYGVAEVQTWLNALLGQLREGVGNIAQMIPREVDGTELQTKIEAPQPRWEGTKLKFKIKLLVEAKVGLLRPDVIEVKLEGKKIEIRPTSGPNPNGVPSVASLDLDIELLFKARDEAMPSVTEQASELTGTQVASCSAIQTQLQQHVRRYVEQLRDAAQRGVRDLKAALR